MNIQFPEKLYTQYFYGITLRKLCSLLYSPIPPAELVIDARQTTFIEPSVLCDLLNYLYLLQSIKNIDVFIKFGGNKILISFLDRCKFLSLSDFARIFKTDIVTISSEPDRYDNQSIGKAQNTEHIRRILLPKNYSEETHEYEYGEKSDTATIRKMLTNEMIGKTLSRINADLISLVKRKKIAMQVQYSANLANIVRELPSPYCEMISNSIRHGCDSTGDDIYCFYTFHFYKDSGLCFGNSDGGEGFYKSLRRKFDSRKFMPSVFTFDEYTNPSNSPMIQSLMGILEGLAYRLNKKLEYGLPYILTAIGLEFSGKIIIHSDYTALVFTEETIQDLFEIEENKLCGTISENGEISYNHYSISAFRRENMRSLVLNLAKQTEYVKKSRLFFYDYCFPGTHISANLHEKHSGGL